MARYYVQAAEGDAISAEMGGMLEAKMDQPSILAAKEKAKSRSWHYTLIAERTEPGGTPRMLSRDKQKMLIAQMRQIAGMEKNEFDAYLSNALADRGKWPGVYFRRGPTALREIMEHAHIEAGGGILFLLTQGMIEVDAGRASELFHKLCSFRLQYEPIVFDRSLTWFLTINHHWVVSLFRR